MLKVYTLEDNRLVLSETSNQKDFENAAWIDLINPTPAEIQAVERFSVLVLPNTQETQEIEASSHYEVYPDGLQINCSFLHHLTVKSFKITSPNTFCQFP